MGNFDQWNLLGAFKATFTGAISGAVTFGIGSIFSAAGETAKGVVTVAESIRQSIGGIGLAVVQGGTHAIAQGVLAMVQGEKFLSAAAGGFFGSLGASLFGAATKEFANKAVGQILFGAISGGIGSELSGGNFWQGALIGGVVAGLNHVMHRTLGPGDSEKSKKALDYKQKYEDAKTGQMAETVLSEAIAETTKPGEVFTKVREKLFKIYGNDNQKEVNKIYSRVISTVKAYKKNLGSLDAKVWDKGATVVILWLEAHMLKLEAQSQYYLYKIKSLDMSVYRSIFPVYNVNSFGGGGAKGNW